MLSRQLFRTRRFWIATVSLLVIILTVAVVLSRRNAPVRQTIAFSDFLQEADGGRIASVVANGLRSRWSPEVSAFFGPLGLAAQFFHEDQELLPGPIGPGSGVRIDVPANGFYVLTTLLLTANVVSFTRGSEIRVTKDGST